MSPEEYEVHRERVLYLSEHPLIERDNRLDQDTRQATLSEVAE